jgi:hypothetical protein
LARLNPGAIRMPGGLRSDPVTTLITDFWQASYRPGTTQKRSQTAISHGGVSGPRLGSEPCWHFLIPRSRLPRNIRGLEQLVCEAEVCHQFAGNQAEARDPWGGRMHGFGCRLSKPVWHPRSVRVRTIRSAARQEISHRDRKDHKV